MTEEKLEVIEATLGEALDKAAAAWGDRTGWIFEDSHLSYAQAKRLSDRAARALLSYGVGKGEIIGIWTPSILEFAIIELACARIGAVLAPINTRFRDFELTRILEETETKILFCVERFLKNDYVAMLDDIGATRGCTSVQHIISLEKTPDPRFQSWDRFLARAEAVSENQLAEREADLHWSEPILLQYTSGSTSAPKGALLNHRYVLNVGNAKFRRMGVKQGEAVLSTQPVYHIGGSCAAIPTPIALGCHMVIPAYYEAERVMQLIEREKCVARTGMPAMFIMEMNHPRFGQYDMSSIRAASCTGSIEVREKVRDAMGIPQLMSAYSSTEAGGTHGHWADPWERRAVTCGRPYEGTEIQIRDPETGAEMAEGEAGEVFIRGWWRMNGYFRQPELNARTIDAQGFVRTGDRAMLDAEGYLHFLGRYKNMIRVGGENVSAEEVEALLLTHPKVKQVAVISMPDERLGEVPMAIIETVAGGETSAEDIIAFCRERMANFRVPRAVRITSEWPMTGSGKIQRHMLPDMFIGEKDLT